MLAISQQEEIPFQHIPTNIQHLEDNAKTARFCHVSKWILTVGLKATQLITIYFQWTLR